jgi:hypothetical protein
MFLFGDFGQQHWSRRLWMVIASVYAYLVTNLVTTTIEHYFQLPHNDACIDVSSANKNNILAIHLLLNVFAVAWGIAIYFATSLFTEYLDYVLFKHILHSKKTSAGPLVPKDYSIWLLEYPFEAIFQMTKNYITYDKLPGRKILPVLPERDFWELAPCALRNLLQAGLVSTISYMILGSLSLKKQGYFESVGLFIFQIAISDWLFFAFHYWMHADKSFYKWAHEDHHSTFGTRGVSALYNQWLDGLLEGSIPYSAAIWMTGTCCKIMFHYV